MAPGPGRGNLSDVHYNLSRWAAQGMIDPYNGGKLIAKLATLVQANPWRRPL